MIDIRTIRSVYFIGIGGIGMSAIARYFRSLGKAVKGYDRTATELTAQLEKEGIAVHYDDNPLEVPKGTDLVVYTPAIPAGHRGLQHVKQLGLPLLKRSEVLGLITANSFNVCVAGTHGKTTISTMIAHLFRDSGFGCNAFLGGISTNYNTNFWSSRNETCVVEADEYDRSFLRLYPDVAVISAVDPDHLDIYKTAENVQLAFIEFSQKIKPGGLLLIKHGVERLEDFGSGRRLSYHISDTNADIYAQNIRIAEGGYVFDVSASGWKLNDIQLNMGGTHNVENALAAIYVGHHVGINDEKIRTAVGSFRGVRRRFEYVLKNDRLVLVDDYAHHPKELTALLTSVRQLFAERKSTVVFQPHLYSRTKDFAKEFAESLAIADAAIILPIYPAREEPIPGVTSETIGRHMGGSARIIAKSDLPETIKEVVGDGQKHVIVLAGAGDIDTLVKPVREAMN